MKGDQMNRSAELQWREELLAKRNGQLPAARPAPLRTQLKLSLYQRLKRALVRAIT